MKKPPPIATAVLTRHVPQDESAASVAVALAASALLIEVLTHQHGRVAVPHPLFYFISVTLPYHWRSGLVLGPLVIVAGGMAGRREVRLSS